MNKIKQSILAIVIGLVLSAGVSYAAGIWENPKDNPPNKNTEAPINVGIENQTKAGGVFFTNPIEGGIRVNGVANFGGVSQFTSSLRITSGSPGVGKVLTSTDTVGTVSWQTPAGSSLTSEIVMEEKTGTKPSMTWGNHAYPKCGSTSVRTGCAATCIGLSQDWDLRPTSDNGCNLDSNSRCDRSLADPTIRVRAICVKFQ